MLLLTVAPAPSAWDTLRIGALASFLDTLLSDEDAEEAAEAEAAAEDMVVAVLI